MNCRIKIKPLQALLKKLYHLGLIETNQQFGTGTIPSSKIKNLKVDTITITPTGYIKLGKDSFTDSTNAGYYFSAEGIYIGSATDTNYLKYALTAFVEKIKSLAIGAAYSALTIEKLNHYKISFPKSLEEQQTIVSKLDALREQTKKLEAVYAQKLQDLEELKKSVLQKAFSGELK